MRGRRDEHATTFSAGNSRTMRSTRSAVPSRSRSRTTTSGRASTSWRSRPASSVWTTSTSCARSRSSRPARTIAPKSPSSTRRTGPPSGFGCPDGTARPRGDAGAPGRTFVQPGPSRRPSVRQRPSDDPRARARADRLGAGAAAELGQDVVDDVLDRSLAVAEPERDTAGVLSLGQHPQHGELALRERAAVDPLGPERAAQQPGQHVGRQAGATLQNRADRRAQELGRQLVAVQDRAHTAAGEPLEPLVVRLADRRHQARAVRHQQAQHLQQRLHVGPVAVEHQDGRAARHTAGRQRGALAGHRQIVRDQTRHHAPAQQRVWFVDPHRSGDPLRRQHRRNHGHLDQPTHLPAESSRAGPPLRPPVKPASSFTQSRPCPERPVQAISADTSVSTCRVARKGNTRRRRAMQSHRYAQVQSRCVTGACPRSKGRRKVRRMRDEPGRDGPSGSARRPGRLALVAFAAAALLTACAGGGPEASGGPPSTSGPGTPTTTGTTVTATTSPSASPAPTTAPAASSPPAPSPPPTASCVDRTLAGLSRSERAAQLLLVGVDATDPAAAGGSLARLGVGGIFLHGRVAGGSDLRSRIASAQSAARRAGAPRLLVAADEEGGLVQTVRGGTIPPFPPALPQGAWTPSTLARTTRNGGGGLAALGVTLALAPVADVVPASLGAANPPIGRYDREYGHTVARVSAAVATGTAA